MARAMLSFLRVTVGVITAGAAATLSSGCFLPPDLEAEGADAGPGAPPVLMRAQPVEFAFPGPMVLDRADARLLSLEVSDADVADTIYVRLYVDYNRETGGGVPTPALADCQAAPSGTGTRFVDCPTNTLCNPIASNDTADHVLDAMASDRPFILDSDPQAVGQPPFRAVAEPDRAATSLRSWIMRCNPPDDA